MKAIIKIDVPDFQIGQEVNIHFKDSMVAKGVVEEENNLPSVSTEKTGRWILTDEKEEIYCHVAICSVCGMESINEGVDDYCSCCGAKMEVEE